MVVKTDTQQAPAPIGVGVRRVDALEKTIRDRHIFCRDRARYVGDPVAGVVAISEEIAEQALDLIEVEYEPLPPVFDPEYGASSEAPLLHPDLGKYVVGPVQFRYPG